jgi:hypothetical protein
MRRSATPPRRVATSTSMLVWSANAGRDDKLLRRPLSCSILCGSGRMISLTDFVR